MRLLAYLVTALLALGIPAAPARNPAPSAGTVSPGPVLGLPGLPVVAGYVPPLTGPLRVVRPFLAPKTLYGAGHRGVDLASREGEAVQAAGGGTVTFAGTIAGRGVVVIAHPDGVRTEYEPVAPSVHAGDVVASGQRIASVQGAHGSCGVGGCLHWGARRGVVYFDPLQLLAPLGVVRLLPTSGAGMGLGVGLP